MAVQLGRGGLAAQQLGQPRCPPAEDAASRDALTQLEGVRALEPDALAAFFEIHFDRMYNVARRLTGDRAGAEDLVQEVFLKVQRHAHRLDATRDPEPWLLSILYRTWWDVLRSPAHRLRGRSIPLETKGKQVRELVSDRPLPEEEIVARERQQLVQRALLALHPRPRAAIVLHDWAGMSHADVARVLGLTYAASKKCYTRALDDLARAMRHVKVA